MGIGINVGAGKILKLSNRGGGVIIRYSRVVQFVRYFLYISGIKVILQLESMNYMVKQLQVAFTKLLKRPSF